MSNNQQAFLALVRAGLWEKEVQLASFGQIDFNEILRLAEEQSVVGLVAAGIEHVVDIKLPQTVVLQFVGQTIQIEQRNSAMNLFIADIVDKTRDADIYSVLVKGQGVAQCYERPQWRSSGDVDLLLSRDVYKKAIDFILPMASESKDGGKYSKEFVLTFQRWMVELHGSLRTGLSGRVDRVVDEVQKNVFYGGNVRTWNNGDTTVFLPAPDNDVFFVFTHFIKHFYKEGMNLRQVCDWCRLLWTYKDSLNNELLVSWIRKAGLVKEWKAFVALAIEYLGMPEEAMPLYDSMSKLQGAKLVQHILKGEPYNKVRDTWAIFKIFPWHTLKYAPSIFFNVNGLKIKERLLGQ